MLSHEGIPLRRIQPVQRGNYGGRFLIERFDRATFCLNAELIGTDEGIDEVIRTAKLHPGEILEVPDAR